MKSTKSTMAALGAVLLVAVGCAACTLPESDAPVKDERQAENWVNQAALTELGTGTWTVGVDLPQGRYTATPPGGESGNLTIKRGSYKLVVNEILAAPDSYSAKYGTPSVTVTLEDGDSVEISGLSVVTFTPAG